MKKSIYLTILGMFHAVHAQKEVVFYDSNPENMQAKSL